MFYNMAYTVKKEGIMDTGRLILYTDCDGNLRGFPKLPPNKQVEIAFSLTDRSEATSCLRRFPNQDIAGKVRIKGNVFDSVAEKDWDLPG
jgi:hypothetical protein